MSHQTQVLPYVERERKCPVAGKNNLPCKNYVAIGKVLCVYHIKKSNKPPKSIIKSPGIIERSKHLMKNNILTREMLDKLNSIDGYNGMTIQEMANMYAPLVFANLCDLAINGITENTKLIASNMVSDRIFGKTTQLIKIDAKLSAQIDIILPKFETIQTINNIIELDEAGNPLSLSLNNNLLLNTEPQGFPLEPSCDASASLPSPPIIPTNTIDVKDLNGK